MGPRPLNALAALLASALPLALAACATGRADVASPCGSPPAPLEEQRYSAPAPSMTWVPGAWACDGVSHVWVPGHWE